MLGKHAGRVPSYISFLLVLLVALAGLPVQPSATIAEQDGFGGVWVTPDVSISRNQSDDIRVGNQTLGSANVTYSANQVVLKYRPLAKKTAAQKHADVKSEKKLLLERVVLLNVTRGKVKDVVEKLKNDPDIEYVEPNLIGTTSFTPNDPYYSYQWHFTAIQMNQAWDISTGSGVTVAVIDTGVAYEDYLGFRRAPDLSGTIFVAGWDFVNNDAHPNDDVGHGTHVTGTIAQTTNNGIGVAGIAYDAQIMPVKVCEPIPTYPYTRCEYAWIADGIVWAVDHGARIVNLSLGGPYSQLMQDAVNYAYNHGVTVVASSGNDGSSSVSYPAACSNVIAVGAVRYDQTRSHYSNYGSALDFVAPGGDLDVDQNGDGYGDGVLQQTFASGDPTNFGYYFYEGTSMAAPHVSGLAALLYSVGYTTPDQIRQKMIDNAKDLGVSGWDPYYGYGLIQAYNSLIPFVSTDKTTYAQGEYLQFTGTGFTPGGSISSCISTNNVAGVDLCVSQPNADGQGNVAGSMLVGSNIPLGSQKFWVTDFSTSRNSNAVQLTITSTSTVTVTVTRTLTESSTSYLYRTTTTTTTSYTSTTTSTSTIPTVTTVILVPLTITSTAQGTQFLTSVLTTTVTDYTSTTTSMSTIPTTVALVASTVTSIVQSIQYLTSILGTTVTNYTGTQTSTSTVVVPTTVVLVPSTVTSTAQSTQFLTSTSATTVTNYTSTETSTSTILVPTTIVLVPLTATSTDQSTRYLTSTSTTTVTNYTNTSTSTSTSVVYTTVTVSQGGAGADVSSPLAYLGFISLLAITAGHRVTAGRSWRLPRSSYGEHHQGYLRDKRTSRASRIPMDLTKRHCEATDSLAGF